MKKSILIAAAAVMMSLVAISPAVAAPEDADAADAAVVADAGSRFFVLPDGAAGIALAAGLGVGLVVIGAAKGIGRIGGSAVESIARQPEAGGRIFTSMLLSAALIEGFTLFAIVVTLLINNNIAGAL
ncbi:MAG: ATP synthase F0 subunit C [Phycisphaeraceae bacterium]|nr:ATP synthase F0 subunit C [Phycisphaeraceae bacterium]